MEVLNKEIFKKYDIRGPYPRLINEKILAQLIDKSVDFLFNQKEKYLVVGHDPRLSSLSLYKTLIKKLKQKKYKLFKVGLISTPFFYFLIKHLKAQGGFMITASHNPKNWNGLKIVKRNKNFLEVISGQMVLKILKKCQKNI